MKKTTAKNAPTDLLRRNWKAKLGSSVLAVAVWWVIKHQLQEPKRSIDDITREVQGVREL